MAQVTITLNSLDIVRLVEEKFKLQSGSSIEVKDDIDELTVTVDGWSSDHVHQKTF